MKELIRKISHILLLALSATWLLATPVSAASSTISFEGGAEDFVFYPGSTAWSDTDLFAGLKNAMPGDVINDIVEVRNVASEYDYVKIYLRADPHDEEANPLSPEVAEVETVASMSDFLAQLSLKIYNGDQLIYESSPDQSATLTNNFLLGDFTRGESTTVRIELSVPHSLSNDYMHRAGEVDWVFTAEGINNPPKAADTGIMTSDNIFGSQILVFVIIFTVAVFILAAIIHLVLRKKSTK